MHAPETRHCVGVATEIDQRRVLLGRCRNVEQPLPADPKPRQRRGEVVVNGVERRVIREMVALRGVAECAQQRTPVIVRADRTVGRCVWTAVEVARHGRELSFEPRSRFVRPSPMTQQTSQALAREMLQRLPGVLSPRMF
jgi:hypothetical protein